MTNRIYRTIYRIKLLKNNRIKSGFIFTPPIYINNSSFGANIVLGRNVTIQNSTLRDNIKIMFGTQVYNSTIGDFSYIANNSFVQRSNIGKFCSIASNVLIGSTEHPMDLISTHPFLYNNKFGGFIIKDDPNISNKINKGIVEIGNDVWIGNGAIILSSIKIGHGSVIGAGSVVTKDVPPYAIIAGVPGRILRFRFNEEEVKNLLEIEWWNWNLSIISNNIELLKNPKEFFNKTQPC